MAGFFGIGSDHELEAYSQHEYGYEDGEPSYRFVHNRDYYHRWVPFKLIEHVTEKAYLIRFIDDFDKIWIPKKIVRKINYEDNKILIHKEIFYKILGNKI